MPRYDDGYGDEADEPEELPEMEVYDNGEISLWRGSCLVRRFAECQRCKFICSTPIYTDLSKVEETLAQLKETDFHCSNCWNTEVCLLPYDEILIRAMGEQ